MADPRRAAPRSSRLVGDGGGDCGMSDLPRLDRSALGDIAALCARAIADPPTVEEIEGSLFTDEQAAVVRGDPTIGVVATVESSGAGHIRLLVVDPAQRRRGHGHALVQ